MAEHRAAWFPELRFSPDVGGQAVANFSEGDCPPPEDNPSDVYDCNVTRFEAPTKQCCVLTFSAMLPAAKTFDDDK